MTGSSGPSGAGPSYHHRLAKVHEYAVSDVLVGGMSMIGTAVLSGVQVADLELWVQTTVAEREADALLQRLIGSPA